MPKMIRLLLSLALLSLAGGAMVQTCCEIKRDAGQTAFNKGQYSTAIIDWTEGKSCAEASCANFNNLIAMAAQKQKAAAAAKSQEPLQAPEARKIPDNMVQVAGGTFTMGDLFAEGRGDETPTHSVTLGNFLMGKTEVTFDEYDAFCKATGHEYPQENGWGRGSRPVINVNWYDAVEYCNWLSQLQGLTVVYTIDKNYKDPNNRSIADTKKWLVSPNWTANGYRLPTEAEWEYAARELGKKVRFGNGSDIARPTEICFGAIESYKRDYSIVGEYRDKTIPVGSLKSPNELGLDDMSGNVWEWCYDWYDSKYYNISPEKDPKGADLGTYRVLRGGSWINGPDNVRCAYRLSYGPFVRIANFGFRVARSS